MKTTQFEEGITVLSLFDGMSCGQVALKRANKKVKTYYASEVNKYAMQVTRYHFPNTNFVGDVTKLNPDDLPIIDLLVGGSPCQGFSFAGKQKGASTKCNIEITTLEQYLTLKDEAFEFEGQSYLFWEFIRILHALRLKNPNIKFFLENVKMTKKWQKVFDDAVNITPIEVNSSLISAQNRKRLYWSNINQNIPQLEDKKIYLKDILEDGYTERDKSLCVTTGIAGATAKRYLTKNHHQMVIKENLTILNDDLFVGKHLKEGYKGGNQLNPNYKSQANTIHEPEGKCATLCAGTHGYANGYVPVVKISKNPIPLCGAMRGRYLVDNIRQDGKMKTAGLTKQYIEVRHDQKTNCLTTVQKDNNIVYIDITDHDNKKVRYEVQDINWRKLTVLECERLQTADDNYTAVGLDENFKEVKISNTQRYHMIGNGWTIDVPTHFFNYI
jgi:DNA (cytosine-5)-methyltransferase 3A